MGAAGEARACLASSHADKTVASVNTRTGNGMGCSSDVAKYGSVMRSRISVSEIPTRENRATVVIPKFQMYSMMGSCTPASWSNDRNAVGAIAITRKTGEFDKCEHSNHPDKIAATPPASGQLLITHTTVSGQLLITHTTVSGQPIVCVKRCARQSGTRLMTKHPTTRQPHAAHPKQHHNVYIQVGDVQNETELAEEGPTTKDVPYSKPWLACNTLGNNRTERQTPATPCSNARQRGRDSHVDVFQNFIPPDECHKVTTPLTRSPCPTATSYSTKMKMQNSTSL